jgi:hypothetical protein
MIRSTPNSLIIAGDPTQIIRTTDFPALRMLYGSKHEVIAVVASTMKPDIRVTCRQTKSSLRCFARAVGLPIT